MSSIVDFFPTFPAITSPQFENSVANKLEFQPTDESMLKKYQIVIGRFLNHVTPYRGLLVVHALGSGKTCTAINMIEQSKAHFRGAIVLAPNENLLANFKNELAFKCTSGTYVPTDWEKLTDGQKTRRLNVATSFYSFNTFEKFSKHLGESGAIKSLYNNKIWVFDEVHELTEREFKPFYAALDLCPGAKIILLSGTPMVDTINELVPILNLLLKPEERIGPKEAITDANGRANARLLNAIKGRVSYLKTTAGIPKTFLGEVRGNLQFLKVVDCPMHMFQQQAYNQSLEFQSNQFAYGPAFKASLALFPDGTTDSFDKFVDKDRQSLKDNARAYFPSVDSLRKYSSIFHRCLINLDRAIDLNRNVFVFSSSVHNTGLYYFVALLRHFGWGDENSRAIKKFMFIDPDQAGLAEKIERFNGKSNINGKVARVLIGSRMIATGFSFMNIQQVEVLTPHWNLKTIFQAIARGTRLNSQKALKNPVFEVSLYTAGVFLYMYEVAEKKEIAINAIEQDLQECAVDCELNRDTNFTPGHDYQPECHYLPCEYKCRVSKTGVDLSSFNVFFAEDAVKKLCARLVDKFEFGGVEFSLEQLESEFAPESRFILLEALNRLVENRRFRNGQYKLAEENNMYFLCRLDISAPKHLDVWYTKNTIVACPNNALKEEILKLISRGDLETFLKLSRTDQVAIFEQGMDVKGFFDYFILDLGGKRYHWINRPKIRVQRSDGKWEPASDHDTNVILNCINQQQAPILNNKYKIVGQYNRANNKFCIQDRSITNTKGKMCPTFPLVELVEIVMNRLQVPIDIGNFKFDGNLQARVNAIRVGKPPLYRDDDYLTRYIYAFDNMKTTDLCRVIQTFLFEKGLVIEDPTCGLSGKK